MCSSTQNILAGLWPCGVIVMLSELFSAESKSQAFAALHEVLTNNKDTMCSLSKCYCMILGYFYVTERYMIIEYVCYTMMHAIFGDMLIIQLGVILLPV